MNAPTRDPLLRRKLVTRNAPPPDKPAVTGPAQGLSRAFARATSSMAPLVAEQGETRRSSASLAELLDMIDSDAFVGQLDGLAAGTAVVMLDQSTFATVIEAMTIGRLGPKPPLPRRPTPTDSSLLADLVNHTMRDLTDPIAAAMRFHRPVVDHRLLAVLLDDVVFDTVSLDVDLVAGEVQRPGRIMLALPRAAPETLTGDPAADSETSNWGKQLEETVMRAPASMQAELGRLTLPLSEVLALGVDSSLTLPLSNLEEVQLVALDGSVQAIGRLGQSRGNRAVRLTSWPGGTPPVPQMSDIKPAPRAKPEAQAGEGGDLAAIAASQPDLPSTPG
ncbi:FliM/FliN family flagellar motor switch protein [Pararhodobacter oceanensis]|uniref:FliM/FliN family flagellar motor switch protein n=1 Tax=Pararhodobacter oceanensis TaxID=2172121 RepID=UPI003A903064